MFLIGTTASPVAGTDLGKLVGYSSAFSACGTVIQFSADGTFTGGSSTPARITFSTICAGNLVPTEKMRITANGNVGIRCNTPSQPLEVCGNVRVSFGAIGVNVAPSATQGRIDASNDIVAFSSDRRLKDNIQTIQCPLYKLQNLSGFLYNWNKTANQLAGYETGSKYVGLYAQEVQSILPEAVKLAPFDNDGQDTSISGCNYLTVQYEKLVPLLVEAIKEQQCQIEELKCSLSILNGGRQ
jgi:hypothetical protein